MSRLTKFLRWLRAEVAKDQHPAPKAAPVAGLPQWAADARKAMQYDFRTGKRNDGREG